MLKTYRRSARLADRYLHIQKALTNSRTTVCVERSLASQVEQVKRIAATTGLTFPILAAKPLVDRFELVTKTTPYWVLYNLAYDPLWKEGAFPVPMEHLQRLQILYRAGVEFDALYVAHELPLDFQPHQDKLDSQVLAPAPPVVATKLSHHLGVATDGLLKLCAAAIRKPVKMLAGGTAATLELLRDPILMGTVISPGSNPEAGVPAVWFLLAAWRW